MRRAHARRQRIGYSVGNTATTDKTVPVYDTLADEELMSMYSTGDAGAFDVLYERHRGALYRFMLRQTGAAAVAEELYQDVWTGIIRRRKTYTATARFTTYLFQVARNRLTDHYRKDKGRSLQTQDYDDDEHAAASNQQPEHLVQVQDQYQRLLCYLKTLPEDQQQAFLLRHDSGFSIDEIAEATGVNHETAKSRLRYAMNKLRTAMNNDS